MKKSLKILKPSSNLFRKGKWQFCVFKDFILKLKMVGYVTAINRVYIDIKTKSLEVLKISCNLFRKVKLTFYKLTI